MNAVFTHQDQIVATPAGPAGRDDSKKSARALIGAQSTPTTLAAFGVTDRRRESFFAVLLRVLAVPHI